MNLCRNMLKLKPNCLISCGTVMMMHCAVMTKHGSYWSCGLACRMDNQPRTSAQYDDCIFHGFVSRIDTYAQQYLSAGILIDMARRSVGKMKLIGSKKSVVCFMARLTIKCGMINPHFIMTQCVTARLAK